VATEKRFSEVFYFSFSALTTIGSSGEEPLTTMTRQLAVVESAMGQVYLAVLISRLVDLVLQVRRIYSNEGARRRR